MILYIDNHEFLYEMECLCRVFFPAYKINVLKSSIDDRFINEDIKVYTGMTDFSDYVEFNICVDYYGEIVTKSFKIEKNILDFNKNCELCLAKELFYILCDITGIRPDWGILTGVRPVKLARRVLSEHKNEDEAKNHFINEFLVTKEKTDFVFDVMKTEKDKILSLSQKDSFSLYIAIPFCPSRCSYCSFVSQSIEKAHKILPAYFELLLKEIQYTADIAKELNLRLETVYIGGGTPTTLNCDQLKTLITTVNSCFDTSTLREFTIEAGRPDTITYEKLLAIKNNINESVLRISINPQTMNDEILENIGRRHTSEQTRKAFLLAKEVGITNINADLIVGLPEDTFQSFKASLDEILTYSIPSITIHTLSIKKSAQLTQGDFEKYLKNCDEAKKMLNYAYETLKSYGYIPYYSYRQSRMVGNLENTGFSKPGFEGFYNAYIMDETHTILACGASAVSKLQQYNSNYLQRIFNFKFPYEYISRFDEIIDRKKGVKLFYDEYF